MNKFWNLIENEDTGQRTLYLDGVIAEESWFGDEITPEAFKNELYADDHPITVHINSVGGDCIAASQIYTMLMSYPSDVTIQIDGLAASAASVIAMAGTKVCMSPTSLMMVHNPWTNASGDTHDMEKAIALLSEVKESIINAYQIKTSLPREQLSELMDSETWMNAYRAKELGFCDEVLFDGKEVPEKTSFSFSGKTATIQLVNRIRDSLKDEAPVEKNTTSMNDYPSMEDSHYFSEAETSSSIVVDCSPVSASQLETIPAETVTPESTRVKVLDADTRLEYLRY